MKLIHHKEESVTNLNPEFIEELQNIGKRYSVEKLVLFGSRAKENCKRMSDIDLAVFCSDDFQDQSFLYFDLEDLDTLLKIDVVFIDNETDAKLLKNIERDGVLIYEQKKY